MKELEYWNQKFKIVKISKFYKNLYIIQYILYYKVVFKKIKYKSK